MKKMQDIILAVVALLLFASMFTEGWISVILAAASAITAIIALISRKK